MHTPRWPVCLVALTAFVVAGCASAPPRPLRAEFDDVPVPKGLVYVADMSTIIESPTVKAARLVYRGRLEPASLAMALRTTFEANGWRNLSSTTTEKHGVTQIYEKNGNSLQVLVWEELWFTYLELTASRALQPAAASGPVR
jgi:hypothetical protein